MEWISVKDRLPNENGIYLVVKQWNLRRTVSTCDFTLNLHELDDWAFPDEKRPGWYNYDSDEGFYEVKNVTHWAKLPEPPVD